MASAPVPIDDSDLVNFIYNNPDFKGIYSPLYFQYTKEFYQTLQDNSGIKDIFEKFGDTAWYETQILNAAQFSAAKTKTTTTILNQMLFNDKGEIIPRDEFRKIAGSYVKITNETWFNVEYETATANIISGNNWRQMYKDRSLYPYWRYETAGDERVRHEHAAMDGKVFRMGSPESDKVYPKNSWNCRCGAELVDDLYLKDNNIKPQTETQATEFLTGKDKETGRHFVDHQFRFNPGISGALPKEGSYFEVMKNANKGQYKMFSE